MFLIKFISPNNMPDCQKFYSENTINIIKTEMDKYEK